MYMKGGEPLHYKYRVMVINQAVIIQKRYLIVAAHNPRLLAPPSATGKG